ALLLTERVGPGLIERPAAIERLSLGPARILGLDVQGGPVAPGRPANLVVFDPSTEWTVGDRPFQSQARYSALTGRRLRGCVLHTMLRGRFTVKEGQPTR